MSARDERHELIRGMLVYVMEHLGIIAEEVNKPDPNWERVDDLAQQLGIDAEVIRENAQGLLRRERA